MEIKTKKIAFAALLTFALASIALVALPIISADEVGEAPTYEDLRIQLQNRRARWRREALLMRFIRSGTYETIEGAISAVTPHLLVIECDGQIVNVIMPGQWVFDGAVMDTHDLLDGQPFGPEDVVSVETLMLTLEKDDHTITSYLAFSIRVGDDMATALLPFNVETE